MYILSFIHIPINTYIHTVIYLSIYLSNLLTNTVYLGISSDKYCCIYIGLYMNLLSQNI